MFKKFSTYICWKKYIKWGVWRVAVCPSYIQDARFLKVNNEIGTASSKIFTQNEFKLGSKIIGTNQSAKIFNKYLINSIDKLITQQPNTESAMFSLRESFPYEFPQIINIPITEAEVICAVSSLKIKTSCGQDGPIRSKTMQQPNF